MKIKDAVNYFDANYYLKELVPHFSGLYSHPKYFRLSSISSFEGSDGFNHLMKLPFYYSRSFEACKRHLKFHFVSREHDDLLFYRIDSFYRGSLKGSWLSSYDYVPKFKFDHHEELCNV